VGFAAAEPGALEAVAALAAEPPPGAAGRFDDAHRAALIAGCAELLLRAWRHFAPTRA